MGVRLTTIADLPRRIESLDGEARARALRLIDARAVVARNDPSHDMTAWLTETFGSVEAVREQTIVKVSNLATGEATLFAPLRSRRPIDGNAQHADLAAAIAATESDPFCDPLTATPADTFGRVRTAHIVSGANAAAADAHHSVLIFDRHDPLAFDAGLVEDLFAAGREWAERAMDSDPGATNYLLIWNCGWRAGGSIVHGHAQALLGSGPHYARLERFRRDAQAHLKAYGAGLVDDLVGIHRDLGLAAGTTVAVLAHLTPIKEREVWIVGSPNMDERDPAFTDAVARTLIAYRDRAGVRAFNLALWRPPLIERSGWEGIPPIVRIVDRGDPFSRSSDIGAMELYGTPIVGSDPYDLIAALT